MKHRKMTPANPLTDLQKLNLFAKSMLQQHDLDELLWDMAETIGKLMEIDDCIIYLLEGDLLVQAAAYGIKNPKSRTIAEPISIPLGEGIVGTVALTKVPELVQDTRLDPRYITDQFDGASEVTVPISFKEKSLGFSTVKLH